MSKKALKKQRRQEEERKRGELYRKINELNSITDYLEDLQSLKQKKIGEKVYTLEAYNTCPEEDRQWVFDLTKKNMEEMYEETWGWKDNQKRRELFSENSHYLIAKSAAKKIGFLHFTFQEFEGEAWVYILELQVNRRYQRMGIGRYLLQALEFICFNRQVSYIGLTVFKINEKANNFYNKMKFIVHPSSPGYNDIEEFQEYDHQELYKKVITRK